MKVLVAEDDPVLQRILEAHLRRWGYEVTLARNGLDASRILESPDAPRLAILDWILPGIEGPELCRRIRQQGNEPYTFLLLLTARSETEAVIKGLESGADDYLVKPIDPHELRARLQAGERILELQDQLIAVRERFRYQAMHDSLTGVWNRGAILEALARELVRARREDSHLGLLMLDVDHFKRVNDTSGHPAGDAVLRDLGRRLRGGLRAYDAVGRVGGEEFLIVLPGCNGSSARSIAERLRAAVASQTMGRPEFALGVTVSIGVAACQGGCIEANVLVRMADAALFRAKRSGRNRVEADPEPDPLPHQAA